MKSKLAILSLVVVVLAQTAICYAASDFSAVNAAQSTVTNAGSSLSNAGESAVNVTKTNVGSVVQNLTDQCNSSLAKMAASTLSVGSAVDDLGAGVLGKPAVSNLDNALSVLTNQTKNNNVSVSAIEAVDSAMQSTQSAVQTRLNQLQASNSISANDTSLLQQSVLKIGAASRANVSLQSGINDILTQAQSILTNSGLGTQGTAAVKSLVSLATTISGAYSNQLNLTQSYGTLVYEYCLNNNIIMPSDAAKIELAKQILSSI